MGARPHQRGQGLAVKGKRVARNLKFIVAAASLVVLTVFVVACGSSGDSSTDSSGSSTSTGSNSGEKIGVATSVTLKSGYGAALQGGVDKIESELGNPVDIAQQVQPSEFTTTLKDFATRGYKLVMLDGADWQEAALSTAPQFPETTFVVVNGFQAAKPNVAAVDFEFEQSGFLAGIAAGLATESNKVGAIGGVELPPLARLFYGYEQGVKYVNPKAQVTVSYTGSWTDTGKAEQVAQAQLSKGVDVIWGIAETSNAGIYTAAQSAGAEVIGYGVDESQYAPGIMITTATVDYGKVFFDRAKEFDEGTLEPKLTTLGFEQDVLGLAPMASFVPKSVADEAEKLAAEAEAGKIEIKRMASGG
jgi:basic membrane protein A